MVLEPAVTCTPATLVRDVASEIVNSPSGIMVLIDQTGNAIGVITLHDILRAQKAFADNQQD